MYLQGDKLSMWLCEAKPQEAIVSVGQRLKGRLGIEEKVIRKKKFTVKIKISLQLIDGLTGH